MNPNNIQEQEYNNTMNTEESKRKEMEDPDAISPEEFRTYTVEGNWKRVMYLYETNTELCTVDINRSRGTSLHVAVNDGNVEVVKSLVGSIMNHGKEEALKLKNERGETPLHLAAARGFKDMCECIIGKNGERKHLITIDNWEGETPLFYAALSWQKQTFVYLSCIRPHEEVNYSRDLIRNNGDSILHCAIRREFFDLALIILEKYPNLHDMQNKDGFSPLKLLATRPSAFWSGSKLIWWKRILYHCIPVGTLNVEEAILEANKESKADEAEQHPKNYDTCCLFLHKFNPLPPLVFLLKKLVFFPRKLVFFLMELLYRLKRFINFVCGRGDHESKNVGVKQKVPQHEIPMTEGTSSSRELIKKNSSSRELVPQNYATCLFSVKFAYMQILGLSGAGVENIRKMKQKHKWSGQLLSKLLDKPFESYLGSGVQPEDVFSGTDIRSVFKPGQARNGLDEQKSASLDSKKTSISEAYTEILTGARNGIFKLVKMVDEITSLIRSATQETDSKKTSISEAHKVETAILTAARNGIVEMVDEIISKVPSAIHETDLEQKNVLLVAVENRQPLVVEALKKRFDQDPKSKVVFDNLILGVDKNENTVLHLAATRSEKDWHISGAALQMMWHIRWFQYIKGLVPEHFIIRTNQEERTAGEIFKESHKELVKNGSEWLRETSESCSVVAALLAGVSFATSSTVPGGNNSDTGEPALEGKPAFDVFALASLIGLCFSATALIMFLSILTSRKEAKDFKIDLPMKLLLGLSSLFLSIVAMFTSFCSGHFFVIDQKYKRILFLIYAITCLPVSFYAVAQFPLYLDLLKAILTKVPQTHDKGDDDL